MDPVSLDSFSVGSCICASLPADLLDLTNGMLRYSSKGVIQATATLESIFVSTGEPELDDRETFEQMEAIKLTGRANLVCLAPKMQSLRLEFSGETEAYMGLLTDSANVHMAELRTLSLTHMCVDTPTLLELLCNHRETLKLCCS